MRVKLEQFDLQSGDHAMVGFVDGWHEPEYNPTTARSWHWMTEKARVWVRPIGRDVTLGMTGESPLKYFDSAPEVRIVAGAARSGASRRPPTSPSRSSCRRMRSRRRTAC